MKGKKVGSMDAFERSINGDRWKAARRAYGNEPEQKQVPVWAFVVLLVALVAFIHHFFFTPF